MKRLLAMTALLLTIPLVAAADDMPGSARHHSGAVGFHNIEAPVGLRWWFASQKIGIDLGLGYSSTPAGSDPDESVTGWAADIGVPFVAHSWDRAHVLLRPGILYESQEVGSGTGPTFDTRTVTDFHIQGEIEAEVFLVDNFSVSASTGLEFLTHDDDLPGVDSQTSFGTLGRNFTNVGFHIYFLGGEH